MKSRRSQERAMTIVARHTLNVNGRVLPLTVRRNRRARRLVLHLDNPIDGAIVTLPPGVPARHGLAMARERAEWLATRLREIPTHVPFVDGAFVPFLGLPHRIRHRPSKRGTVWREAGEIHVAGQREHLARRLTDWLKAEARREIVERAEAKARMLGKRHGRITLRDTRSLWGSCSANGNLSFCWRLVMMPEDVLDYVVAHEVAHLVWRSHGTRFWAAVDKLTSDVETARNWLRQYGERVHVYG